MGAGMGNEGPKFYFALRPMVELYGEARPGLSRTAP
jgi:hypothetical protein